MSGQLPDILELTEVGEQRYHVFQPAESAEGRDVVFSGQLMAQMMMASDREAAGAKDIRSVHSIFARAGTYTLPIEVDVDSMQAGRTWASDAVTATQGGKLLSRALILMSTVDDDLMRHDPAMPDVPGPEGLDSGFAFIFPGAEWRPVPGEPEIDGVPVERAWHRYEPGVESQAANQGIAGLGHLRQHHRAEHAPPPGHGPHRGRPPHPVHRGDRPHPAFPGSLGRFPVAVSPNAGYQGGQRPGLRPGRGVHLRGPAGGHLPARLHGQSRPRPHGPLPLDVAAWALISSQNSKRKQGLNTKLVACLTGHL